MQNFFEKKTRKRRGSFNDNNLDAAKYNCSQKRGQFGAHFFTTKQVRVS